MRFDGVAEYGSALPHLSFLGGAGQNRTPGPPH